MNTELRQLIKQLGFPKKDILIAVETGTYHGEGVEALSGFFKKIFTIELSNELYKECLAENKSDYVHFFLGESNVILSNLVVSIIDGPYLLFLDAHGSGGDTTYSNKIGRYGSPVLQELDATKSRTPEVIIIDDTQSFKYLNTYPKIEMIINKVDQLGNYNKFNYRNMMVFIRCPKSV